MSWMISSGVSLSRCVLVSAAAQAIRPGSAEPTRATAPPTPATLRNARRPSRSGLRMLILLDRALLLALEPRAYGAALRCVGFLTRKKCPEADSVFGRALPESRITWGADHSGARDGAFSRLVPAFSPQSSRMKVTSIFDRYSVTLPFSTWAV